MLKAGKAKSSPGEKESGEKNYGVAYVFRGDFGVKREGRVLFSQVKEKDLCRERVVPQGNIQQDRKGKGLWVTLSI